MHEFRLKLKKKLWNASITWFVALQISRVLVFAMPVEKSLTLLLVLAFLGYQNTGTVSEHMCSTFFIINV